MFIGFLANMGKMKLIDPFNGGSGGGGAPALLLESGSYILLENGSHILLE